LSSFKNGLKHITLLSTCRTFEEAQTSFWYAWHRRATRVFDYKSWRAGELSLWLQELESG